MAIAGAVTGYQNLRNSQETSRETLHLGFLAHEMRNALTSANLSFQLIKKGTVGLTGNTSQVVERSHKLIGELIDRALTDVRLRVDPDVRIESGHLLQVVDEILVSATVEVEIDPALVVNADQQAFHSALSNLIQNALKFSRTGGTIQVRGKLAKDQIEVEVEDECGGLLGDTNELFKPYVQKNENRKGLGLGLTIAQRAIELNHGHLEVQNLLGKGCIFKITLPTKNIQKVWNRSLESKYNDLAH